jgi:nicotinate-nucleotide--dimethylbenzimidazole phosphoribosyltransferase
MNVMTHQKMTQNELRQKLEARVAGKAKPIGALGRLETLAVQIGMVTGSLSPTLGPARVVVFAGDHGITAEGVTAYPSVVTAEIAKIILAGGAGINICARAANVDVTLVDAGLLTALPPHPNLLDRRIDAGTKNSRREPAMSEAEFQQAYSAGQKITQQLTAEGVGILAFGEVGIGNTSASALVGHAVSGIALEALIGPGAGAPALGLDHKRLVLAETRARAALPTGGTRSDVLEALRQFGGFEMVMMAGAMTAAASQKCIVIVDGFIATSVAAAAIAIEPALRNHCIFAHCSAEPGHRALLNYLEAEPLFDLGLRLGEGTGAALAIPFVRAAEGLLRDMADLPGEHPA